MTTRHHQQPDYQANNYQSSNEVELADSSLLADEETKKVLTPFAFKIDESLFGIPLALPWRRGLALSIDLLLIAILSSAPGELLAIVVAMTFYKFGNAKGRNKVGRLKRFRRLFFRFLGAFIVFVVLLETLPKLFNDSVLEEAVATGELGWAEGIALGALSTATYQKITASSCENVECWKTELLPFVGELPVLTLDDETVRNLVDTMVVAIDEKKNLDEASKKELVQYFFNQFQELKVDFIVADSLAKPGGVQNIEQRVKAEKLKTSADGDSTSYKGVDWLKGIIDDLGLGFGWAAFYFTVLTSIWHGQTPGKKLFKIRVIQLDGTKLSLWDSFGRYGGYGAGLATGLLGFIQIYWDPNRQAIHDKISATIVIDVTVYDKMKAANIEKSSV